VKDPLFFWLSAGVIAVIFLFDWIGLLSETAFFWIVALFIGLSFLYLRWRQYWRHPEQYGYGTVVSKRQDSMTTVEQNVKLYWVTFRFQSGEEIELQVFRSSKFKELNEGDQGAITYRGDQFVRIE